MEMVGKIDRFDSKKDFIFFITKIDIRISDHLHQNIVSFSL